MPLIPDRVINIEEKDLLGTLPYVEILHTSIKEAEAPFTIGLFGEWGSGKSSILKTLQERIEKKEKDIKMFVFDAWKYSKDPLRRSLIIELAKFFKLKSDKYEKILYETRSVGTKANISVGVAGINSEAVTIIHRVEEAEKFEELFKEILRKGLKKHNLNKVVIAIDNIDRCNDEYIKEVLMTVKNFLENENCIFIIALDEDRARKIFSDSIKDKSYASEYLRKIFNTIVKIKKYSPQQLFDFATSLNEEYNLGFDSNILGLIAQEFSRNPRRIIQFLNNLYLETKLVEIREKSGLIRENVVSKNLLFLAKLQIIMEEWPELYEKLYKDKTLLEKINQSLLDGLVEKVGNKWILKSIDSEGKERKLIEMSDDQYFFFKRTQNITIPAVDLDPFFVNKDLLKGLPDELFIYVTSQNLEKIKKLLDEGLISIVDLFDYILKMIDETIIKREIYETSGYNILALIFDMMAEEQFLSSFNTLYNRPRFFALNSVLEIFSKHYDVLRFNYKGIIYFSRELFNKGEEGFLENIIESLSQDIEKILKGTKKNEPNEQRKIMNFIKLLLETYKDQEDVLTKVKPLIENALRVLTNFEEELVKIIYSEKVYLAKLLDKEDVIYLLKKVSSQTLSKKDDLILMAIAKRVTISKNQEELNAFLNKIDEIFRINRMLELQKLEIIFELLSDSKLLNLIEKLDFTEKLYRIIKVKVSFLLNIYQRNVFTEESPLKIYEYLFDILKCIYISKNIPDIRQEISNIMINFLFGPSEEMTWLTKKALIEVIEKAEPHRWLFTDAIIKKLVEEKNEESFERLSDIIEKMLERTEEGKGLSTEDIRNIIVFAMDAMVHDNSELAVYAQKWLINLSKISNPLLEQEILYNMQHLIKLDKILAKDMLKNILKRDGKNIKNIQEKFLEMLKTSTEKEVDIDFQRELIDLVTDLPEIITEEIAEEIGKQFIRLLTNEENRSFVKYQLKKCGKLSQLMSDKYRKSIDNLIKG